MKQNNFFILLLIAGFTTIMTAQVPSYVPTNGLVGYWPFNGNANDVSTNANNGTNNGATLTTDRFGNANSAYFFNKSEQDNITIANTSSYNFSNSYSINLWYKLDSNQQQSTTGVDYNVFISKHQGGTYNSSFIIYTENVCRPSTYMTTIDDVIGYISDPSMCDTSNWHMITMTFGSSNLKMYFDGILYNTVTGLQNIKQTTLPIIIGEGEMRGNIDDIGIWNRALTTDEITNLYNANICYQSVTVTDTLVINVGILGYNPVTYANSITIYPNPANDHITIDCGTLSSVTGYQIKISNLLGQEVFSTTLNQQQYSIPLNSWTGRGIYLVKVYDANNNLLTTRKIDLQ
jgi:hypothetical protein